MRGSLSPVVHIYEDTSSHEMYKDIQTYNVTEKISESTLKALSNHKFHQKTLSGNERGN